MEKVSINYLAVVTVILLIPAIIVYGVLGLDTTSSTMKYVKSVGAILNDGDFTPEIFGGILMDDSTSIMQEVLSSSDDITNREELMEAIEQSQNGLYTQYMKNFYDMYKNNTEDWQSHMEYLQENAPEVIDNYIEVFEEFENQNLDITGYEVAWEVGYASWGYVAGYLTFEEAAEICVEAAQRLQEKFSSWEEYQKNFLLGSDFNSCTTISYKENHTYIEEQFENLKNSEYEFFDIDFNAELNVSDMNEKYIGVGMAKEERWKYCIPVALLVVWLGWMLIPSKLFKEMVKKSDNKLKSENFGANYSFNTPKNHLWINSNSGELAVVQKWNPFEIQKFTADKIGNISLSDGATPNYETKQIKVNFDINGTAMEIPIFVANEVVSLDDEDVQKALKKAEIYMKALKAAKEKAVFTEN